jgi:hypothetical protein
MGSSSALNEKTPVMLLPEKYKCQVQYVVTVVERKLHVLFMSAGRVYVFL